MQNPPRFQGFYQPVLFELVEGLPHRGAADPQLLGKMLLRKAFTGGEPSGKDGGFQIFVGLLPDGDTVFRGIFWTDYVHDCIQKWQF